MNESILSTSDSLVEVHGLGHTYLRGTPLAQESLRSVDLTVERGQTVVLVGATGSGKSTLLQHLNGLLRPQRGQVRVLGHDLSDPAADLRAIRRAVGLVFQRPGDQLFEHFVGDDVAFAPRQMGLRGAELRERVRWAMEWAGLDFQQYKDRPVFALSGGERRQVGLAGVLALKPRILLLDEPTAGLDPVARDELLVQLQTLHAEGLTLIVATHNMDDVAALADQVYVLTQGQVALSGATRAVFAEVDRLRDLGLDVPFAASLMAALRAHGLDVPLDVLTLAEAEAAILAHFGRGSDERLDKIALGLFSGES
ncbi:MAG: energy-coupling factor transporter ATPase [Anaerolineae bacterium]|nr:energy-coupling factor transporter ATPase [Anaerolineae bacterium]